MSRYRCFFAPDDGISQTGTLPFVQLHAAKATEAAALAHYVTGRPIVEVERREAADAKA
jgi:hypothetical protein